MNTRIPAVPWVRMLAVPALIVQALAIPLGHAADGGSERDKSCLQPAFDLLPGAAAQFRLVG